MANSASKHTHVPTSNTTSPSVESSQSSGPSTRAVHGGTNRPYPNHSITQPIVHAATYTFNNSKDLRDFMEKRLLGGEDGRSEYGRYGNPTIQEAESRLAALDGAGDALLFSSGMAAITTILLAMLPTGSHVIMTDDCYRQSRQFCQQFLKRLGINCTLVPAGDYSALEAAIQPSTRLLISESPSNPYLRVLDFERLVDIAQRNRVKTLVDATFATPLNCQPLNWGIDLVVHSATKYLAGHNDLLAGVVTGEESLIAAIRNALGVMGAVLDPNNAYLLVRGLKTLGLRIERQNQNGQAVAEFLESSQEVEKIWYPGLESHPDHILASRYYSGHGGVVSFTVKGDLDLTAKFIDALRLPLIAASLGGVETLVEQPAIMSYYELSREERGQVGILDNLVRLSLGIEDTRDLIDDLDQAFRSIR